MNYLLVGGPLDGRAVTFEHAPKVLADANVPGAYVLSPLSDQVTIYHWKTPEPSRWEKRQPKVAWPLNPPK